MYYAQGRGKFKPFSEGSGFTGHIFTGESSGVDSARALRQGDNILLIRLG